MASQFKVGDKVVVKAPFANDVNICSSNKAKNPCIEYYMLTNIDGSGSTHYTCHDKSGTRIDSCNCYKIEQFEHYNSYLPNNMSLLQKAQLAFKGEPQKSFIKSGLMDGNEIATDDGVKLYVTYLMKKDTAFKTDVVDVILAEESKK